LTTNDVTIKFALILYYFLTLEQPNKKSKNHSFKREIKIMSKRFLITFFILIVMLGQLFAQPKYPRVSPGATVSQMIGITEVKVTFHRPGVKGRLVWDELVPLDKIWRAGANEATTIEFSHDVTIGETLVPAGKYSLFIIPTQKDATFIINKNAELWGTFGYKQEEDVVRIIKKTEYLNHMEWLQFSFSKLRKNSAVLSMHWEDFSVGFAINVDTDKYVLEGARKAKGWEELSKAAIYCLENEVALDEGRAWIDKSLAEERNYRNLGVKAEYLAHDGDLAGAQKIMKEAIEMGKKMERVPHNIKEREEQLKEWETK
jgi:hypothetical protein